jgi:KaiC/GvpD/RAD55 family RecA-like ATPase
VAALDDMLGGGLIPGTLTVVVGATGIGKTQLGLQYANAGLSQEGRRGVLFDMASRGDSQSHAEYARRLCDWQLRAVDPGSPPRFDGFFDDARAPGDYLHVFGHAGRRVTRHDLDWDAWQDWQAEMAKKLGATIGFFYGNFVRGARRAVVDGIEPVDRPSESIQFELFEYVYHQVLRKDADWVARDLFRQSYRAHATEAAAHAYDPASVSCMLLYTSREALLDELACRPLDEGDVLSNANTVICLGKIRDGLKIGRGLYVAKHRGSACSDEIAPFVIEERGLRLLR